MPLLCDRIVVVGNPALLPKPKPEPRSKPEPRPEPTPIPERPAKRGRYGTKCDICARNVFVGTARSCRCGLTSLCARHRLPEDHACSFDFKTLLCVPEPVVASRVSII